jgi:signal transduction histidine kinase
MGIRRRLLLSFLLLFVLVLAVAGLGSRFLIARAVEDQLEAQTENLARLFAASPGLFHNAQDYVKQAYGAESVALVPAGTHPAGPGVFRAPVPPDREFVIVYSPDTVSRAKARTVRLFAAVAAAGLLLVLVLGYLTAQAIARPLEELSRQARTVPAGGVRPVGGGAEFDHLVDALNRMLEEVRRLERLAVMGQMAAGVAHEVRNPLSSIKMTVQMLREGAREPEPYALILREIERLELTAAELMGASQPLRRERARLEGVVDEVLELMGPKLDHLSVRVEKRYAPAPEVEIDVARFKRCVMNLILNGAQAMPSGGPLSVEVAPRNGRARFSVTDSGGGVPDAVRGRVFEPFVTTKQDGVGLGLALTKRIVEDHGGAIGFEEGKGGATFWIELDPMNA